MKLKVFRDAAVNRIGFILGILFFGVLFFTPLFPDSLETGYKYFKNYSNKDYDHQQQNWGMVQAKNGLIYVANHGGVLEYDGVSWRIIGVPEYATVRSLAIDETGVIYVGGIGEFGYLAPDDKGALTYNSLVEQVPENQRDFSDVWKTYTSGKGIYFHNSKFLFRWDPKRKKIKVWEPEERFYFSYMCDGKLFIRLKNVGLAQMVDESLEKVPGGEIFKTRKIYMMVPYDSESILIGTMENGFYIYNGSQILPFPTDVDDYLKKNLLYNGIRLTSGDFALATLRGGLVVMDARGRQKHLFAKNYGLLDDTVYNVFEDKQGNLWLCLSTGISKIEYVSPISVFDERSGLSGLIFSVVRHRGKLYVGTPAGLYHFESSSKFRLVPGILRGCWSLCSVNNSLLAATEEGIFLVDTKNYKTRGVTEESAFVLLPSKHSLGLVWCGTSRGLVSLSKRGEEWVEGRRVKGIEQEIRSIAEDPEGNVWLGTLAGGVLKIDTPVNTDNPSISRYDATYGLPDGEVYIAVAAGHIVFASKNGLFRFDEKPVSKNETFVADSTLGLEFAGGPNSKPVYRIVEDSKKNIWFHSQSRNYQAVPGEEGKYTINAAPFRRIPTTLQVNAIYPDPDGKTVWFASQGGGLIRGDITVKKNYLQDFHTLVRRVIVNDRSIFDGYKDKTGKVAADFLPTIEYKDRNLRFEFAAPFFEDETETWYQSFLEGYDDDWTNWNKETKSIYTNLDPGLYTFRVRAKNVYEHLGEEDIFQFKILPPWYQTWWAYVIYGFGFFLFVFLVVKWRSRRLIHEKKKLEQIVRERTRGINEKSQQLKQQTVKLKDQSEKLKEMDEVKSRFFANISHEFRTPLTLIMSPLEQMLSISRDKKQKNEIKMILRNSQRLLTLINQLLDLSRFDSGKIKLQATSQNIVPFLKGILTSFHTLAVQNQLELDFQPGDEKDISIYFEAPKMEEVIVNLLINAVKFTPAGGRITLSVSKEGAESSGLVRISVRDTGIGIPKEQFSHIFDRFYQAGNLKKKGHKGTGIGLALVKEIITLHHGKIDVHSQEGKGTEFNIRLPLGAEHLEPEEIVELSEMVSDYKKGKEVEALFLITEEDIDRIGGQGDEDVGLEKDTVSEDKTEEHEKNVLLLVEDNGDVRKHIRDSLKSLYTVVEAGDGKEGIANAKEFIPDLIISDIMMPEADGYELCRVLKQDIKTSHIPIILLTSKASEDSIIQGLEIGADEYVTKPFNINILIARIKNLIDQRRQLQLKFQSQKMVLPSEIPLSSLDEAFLKEFQDIIEKNLSNPDLDEDQLCLEFHMSQAALFRKIQSLTGESPNQFIQSYRLERSAQLLKTNFGNVTEVAFEVGFSSTGHFAKCFKARFHQLPTSFQTSGLKLKPLPAAYKGGIS